MGVPDYAGQAVIVTGGTRGIGAGIAREFLRAGARVLVCARSAPGEAIRPTDAHTGPGNPAPGRPAPGDPARGQQAGEARPRAGWAAADFVQADIRQPAQARAVVDTALARYGRLDVLVSNAGGSPYLDAAKASPNFHAKVIELNLIAPLHVAQCANAVMQDQPDGGSIVFVGSVSGTRPSPGTAAYGAAKAGLHHLATSLAVEWGPKVRVNSVVPGFVATEAGGAHYGDAAASSAIAASVPLGRMATSEDVAGACLFLASPQAAYVSGASLLLHGGGEPPPFLAAVQRSVYAPKD